MSPRTGRPIAGESRKDAQIAFRVAPATITKLEECQKILGKTKVEIFEEMVDELHNRLTREQ